jgi:protein-L-isoaspartate(D-aspartate) O-methyltransferase
VDYAIARERMVLNQLKGRGIRDEHVLQAMRTVPRHRFVPEELRSRAYGDHPLPIGEGQTISQPYMVAFMTEQLQVEPQHVVLEIGTGSGYQAAVLAELVTRVISIERIPELADRARQALDELGYRNVVIRWSDGTIGWPEMAPFERIIVTAGAPAAPPTLVDQLADGGRMVVPLGNTFLQTLTVVTKTGGQTSIEERGGCTFVPLIGEEGWKDRG